MSLRGLKMYCSMCGAKLPDGARFCSMCGASTAAVAAGMAATEAVDNGKNPLGQQPAVECNAAASLQEQVNAARSRAHRRIPTIALIILVTLAVTGIAAAATYYYVNVWLPQHPEATQQVSYTDTDAQEEQAAVEPQTEGVSYSYSLIDAAGNAVEADPLASANTYTTTDADGNERVVTYYDPGVQSEDYLFYHPVIQTNGGSQDALDKINSYIDGLVQESVQDYFVNSWSSYHDAFFVTYIDSDVVSIARFKTARLDGETTYVSQGFTGFIFSLATGERITPAEALGYTQEVFEPLVFGGFEANSEINPPISAIGRYWRSTVTYRFYQQDADECFFLTDEGLVFGSSGIGDTIGTSFQSFIVVLFDPDTATHTLGSTFNGWEECVKPSGTYAPESSSPLQVFRATPEADRAGVAMAADAAAIAE